jgi:hypothetical protein
VRGETATAYCGIAGARTPKPIQPRTIIRYQLVTRGHVLKVYDMLGSEVVTLVDGVREAGQQSVQFDASNRGSGMYFYRLQTNDFVETKRMILIK